MFRSISKTGLRKLAPLVGIVFDWTNGKLNNPNSKSENEAFSYEKKNKLSDPKLENLKNDFQTCLENSFLWSKIDLQQDFLA